MAVSRKDRKLTSPTDPVKGGSKKKVKPTPAATPAPAGKKRGKKAEPTAADKKFDAERAKHLDKERAKNKKKSLEQRLKDRLVKYAKGLTSTMKSQAQLRKLIVKRQAVARYNMAAKQKAGYSNLLAKQKARLAARKARKPSIKDGKIVTPKVAPKQITLKKPKLKPMPRLKGGKETTAKQVHHAGTAGDKAAGKKAARTKKTGKVTV